MPPQGSRLARARVFVLNQRAPDLDDHPHTCHPRNVASHRQFDRLIDWEAKSSRPDENTACDAATRIRDHFIFESCLSSVLQLSLAKRRCREAPVLTNKIAVAERLLCDRADVEVAQDHQIIQLVD